MAARTLGVRLSLAFAVVAVLTVALAMVMVGVGVQRQFGQYVKQRLQDRADTAAALLGREYERSGTWARVDFSVLAQFAAGENLHLRVLGPHGDLVAYSVEGGMVQSPEADDAPRAVSARAPIIVRGRYVGEVLIATTSPGGLLTARDRAFRRSLLWMLVVVGLVAAIAASIAGAAYTRSIVAPINAVTRVAAALRSGDRSARTGMRGDDAIGALGSTLDTMADAIEADQEAERRLTADVAHELRTPLQAIQATVEAMQDGVLPTDEERLSVLHDETVRLGRLVGSILELSQLERGTAAITLSPLDPAGPVEQAIEGSRALMESVGLTLSAEVEHGLTVMGDPDRLTQAVANLLSNAARYTPAGGSVQVGVSAEEGSAVIEVRDTGIGVAPEDRDRAFTRFWRADRARARASGGLGIGLAVVREIVERHAGTVALDAAEGGGTVVRITLPLAAGASA